MKPRRVLDAGKKILWAKIALENIAHVSKVLAACMIPFSRVVQCQKKICPQSETSVAQWLERRQHYMIFFLALVQSPLRCSCNFFFWPVFIPTSPIRVKGDCFCIFALFKDTNNFCKPFGEKFTKKFTQKVTFTYSKKFILALLWSQSTTSDIYVPLVTEENVRQNVRYVS